MAKSTDRLPTPGDDDIQPQADIPTNPLRPNVDAVQPVAQPEAVQPDGEPEATRVVNLRGARRREVSDLLPTDTADAQHPVRMVNVHVHRLGLSNIPAIADIDCTQFDTAEAYADAVTDRLRPFASLGLNIDGIRANLLLPSPTDAEPVCVVVDGRPFLSVSKLGNGGSASTELVVDPSNPAELFVMKTIHANGGHMLNDTSEIHALARIGELVASSGGTRTARETERIVMRYHEGPTLHAVLQAARGKGLPPQIATWMMLNVARELSRTQNMWHLDIKGGNIIVTPSGNAKLVDWGAAQIVRPGETRVTPTILQATLPMSAPETNADSPSYTAYSDVYTLLLLAYELLSGEPAVPDHVDAPGMSIELRMRRFFEHKAKYDPHGEGIGILRHLNTERRGGEDRRTNLERITDWNDPSRPSVSDAGAKMRELFAGALQTQPEQRTPLPQIIQGLERICKQLGVDSDHGPVIGDLVRDTTKPLPAQVSADAMYAALTQHNPSLERVELPVDAQQNLADVQTSGKSGWSVAGTLRSIGDFLRNLKRKK